MSTFEEPLPPDSLPDEVAAEAGSPPGDPEGRLSPEAPDETGAQGATSGGDYFCSYHPDRRAQGVCMACRKVVCNECSTKIDGINHCITCLQRKAAAPETREIPFLQETVAAGAVACLFGCGYGLVFLHGWWW